MNLTSSSSNANLTPSYGIPEDSGISSSIDVKDDTIPVVEKAPTSTFVGLNNFPRGFVLHFARRPIPYNRRSCFILVVHICATAHLSNWVFGDCLGGPAKRVGSRRENITFF
jgi:hypothetical protein